MRSALFSFMVFFFIQLVEPNERITIFDLFNKVKELDRTLLDLKNGSESDQIHGVYNDALFENIDIIGLRLQEIHTKLNGRVNDLSIIVGIAQNIGAVVHQELNLHTKYIANYEDYANSTLINFANEIVSQKPNSVSMLMNTINLEVTRTEFIEGLLKYLNDPNNKNIICKEQLSPLQIFYGFISEIMLLQLKSYYMINVAYNLKKHFNEGNFITENEDATKEFKAQVMHLLNSTKPYRTEVSGVLWKCDSNKQKKKQTFIQITNFLHGYILSEENLDPSGSCGKECSFNNIKTQPCNGNEWCESQVACPKIVNCQKIESRIEICQAKSMNETHRRYRYIGFTNGTIDGKKEKCTKTETLENYKTNVLSWWDCSYCFCICDEGPKYFSKLFVNLRSTTTDYKNNKVVTGVRFVEKNRTIHLQLQEAKLLPNGLVDMNSISWVAPSNYNSTTKGVEKGKDYHTISWEKRSIDLQDIQAPEGYVVIGTKFLLVGDRLTLGLIAKSFNFTTGLLERNITKFVVDNNLMFNYKFKSELKLKNAKIPQKSENYVITTDKFVKFTYSDLVEDAGQTTVPFIDAQEVVSKSPTPLSGLGIFHKGSSSNAGFIAPRIFTYNFAQHRWSIE